jgi:DNA-binding transcriptional ArsR family regulator
MLLKSPKVTLDVNTFKALASETRLGIMRALDGSKMGLNDLSATTGLHKATLHEHLAKLVEVGLVTKIEREGYKWVYYKLSWQGANLLHPENSRIVVLFSVTIVSLAAFIVGLFSLVRDTASENRPLMESLMSDKSSASGTSDPWLDFFTIACFIIFVVFLLASVWRYGKNKTPRI